VADVLRLSDVAEVCSGLSDIAAATLTAALQAAVDSVAGRGKLATRFCVVGMGRLGGAEMSYSSDADLMFVYEPLDGADERAAGQQALAVANELRRLLSLPSPDPGLTIDADLRPEGRNGPLVRSLASYAAYYERWASAWESQALLRARPISGDPDLGDRFTALIDPLRYPQHGLAPAHLIEIRRLKARMESERLPRGADPSRHVKLGPGGLSDVEWTVQLLQMQHAARLPALRTTRTVPALREANAAGLLADADAQTLVEAWQISSRIRNAVMLATGRASDLLPRETKSLARVAHLMGYRRGDGQQLLEDHRRSTRRARRVVERVFYGG
jgi:glutamate-ammonia-ligase adenylyltransferase